MAKMFTQNSVKMTTITGADPDFKFDFGKVLL